MRAVFAKTCWRTVVLVYSALALSRALPDTPSYHFRTYGDARFDRAKARLVRTARKSGWFNTTVTLGPSSLPAAFRRRYAAILRQPRGGGYWIWKLAVFHLALEHMADGDFLVYLDAGCELNLGGAARFRDYVAMVDASPYDVLSFEVTHPEHKWTTDRVFRAFGVVNRTDPIRLSRQYVGGILIMQSGPHLHRWLDLVGRVLDSDPWLITDRYNHEARAADPAFIEARHDQSMFSVSRKLMAWLGALLPGLPGLLAAAPPHRAADVYADDWVGVGVYATYSPLATVSGPLVAADPPDGCGVQSAAAGSVLVATLLPNSSCTPLEQVLYGAHAGAVGVINVAEGAGEGYIWIMQSTAVDDALRLSSPAIPHVSVSRASGAALGQKRLKTVRIRPRGSRRRGGGGGVRHPTYVFACVVMVFGVIIVPAAVLRLFCRPSRRGGDVAVAAGADDGAAAAAVRAVLRGLPTTMPPGPGVPAEPPVDVPPEPPATCAVCLDALADGTVVRMLLCGHEFHARCVDVWLVRRPVCPLCKDNVLRPRSVFGHQTLRDYFHDYHEMLATRGVWQDGEAGASWIAGTHIGNWVLKDPGLSLDAREAYEQNTRAMCTRVEHRLRSAYWVGFTETLDADLGRLGRLLGRPLRVGKHNVNHHPTDLDPEVVLKLTALTTLDHWLYNNARQLASDSTHRFSPNLLEPAPADLSPTQTVQWDCIAAIRTQVGPCAFRVLHDPDGARETPKYATVNNILANLIYVATSKTALDPPVRDALFR
eukprot:gene5532-790_t